VTDRFVENDTQLNPQPIPNRSPTDPHNLDIRSKIEEEEINKESDDLKVIGLIPNEIFEFNGEMVYLNENGNITYINRPKTQTNSESTKNKKEPSNEALALHAFICQSILDNLPKGVKPPSKATAHYLDEILKTQTSLEIQSVIIWAHKEYKGSYYKNKTINLNSLVKYYSEMLVEKNEKKIVNNLSIKDQVLKSFKHGEKYNGAECFIDDLGIAFQRGLNHQQVKFSEKGFWDQFENMIRKMNIQISKIA
jgi:hypothetical protein